MNVLAHIYLSGDSDNIIIGNYIGDYVKGRDYLKYPEGIRKGIIIPRRIDAFTDWLPVVHRSKLHFVGRYRKYAGVIIDILYDHYLTREWDLFSRSPLESVTYKFYRAMVNNFEILPETVREKMPFFIIDNWLETYQTRRGIRRVLKTLSGITSLPKETRLAMRVWKKQYYSIEEDFMEFFPQLISYVESEFGIELSPGMRVPF